MTTQDPSQPGDLFFEPIVDGYLSNPRFVRRDWLAGEVDHRLSTDGSRFVLLTAEPGFGKSAFMAQLAADHPDWPRYFIRRDQRASLSEVGARSFLLRIGFQLASLYPELFTTGAIRLTVEQRVGAVKEGGSVVGAEIERILASPFYKVVIQIQQQIEQVEGRVVGLRIGELVIEPRLLELADLQHMALNDPARVMQRLHPDRKIVIQVDALDEVRYHQADDNILAWLANCPDLPSNIRFILTSRPPEGSVSLFMDKQKHVLQALAIAAHDPGAATEWSGQVAQDLGAYVDRLASDAVIKTHLDGLPGGAAGFKQQAVANAGGNIGYLDALARAVDQALVKQDGQILAELLAVKTLPGNLQDLYAFFLHQIKQSLARQRVEMEDPETGETYDKSVWPAVHSRMLAVLAVAREPVSLEQIQYLGGITTGWADLNAAKDSLLQFLDIVDSRYRLYHATLPEFLTGAYTQGKTGTEDLYVDAEEWHKRIGNRYWRSHSRDWSQCDDYGLRHLPAHLAVGGQQQALSALLLTFPWLQAKLDAAGIAAVITDYDLLPLDYDLRLVRDALRLSAHVLACDKTQFAGQLLGRLLAQPDLKIQSFLAETISCQTVAWLHPVTASLESPGGPLERTLIGHTAPIMAVAVTPDGQRAISGSQENTLMVWDLRTGAVERTLNNHTGFVNAVVVMPDGRRAISSADHDKTLKVWDLQTGAVERILNHSVRLYGAVAVTPDGNRTISASVDDTLKVWNLETGTEERTLTGHTETVTAMAVTPDGRWVISASKDKTLKVWNLETGAVERTLTGHTGQIDAVAVTPDGRQAISASSDKALKVWNLLTGIEERTLIGHTEAVTAVAVTPDGRQAISGSEDKTLKVWNLATGAVECTLTGHIGRVSAIAVTSNGQRVVSASWDKTLKVWNLQILGAAERTPTGHTNAVKAVMVTPDGRRAISGSGDKTLKVWNLETGAVDRTLTGHAATVAAVAVTPDGQRAISASWDKTLKVWNLRTGVVERTLTDHTYGVTAVAITPDGQRVISASSDGHLIVRDMQTGAVERTLVTQPGSVSTVAVTLDGQRVISVTSWNKSKIVKVWDLRTGVVEGILRVFPKSPLVEVVTAVTADGWRAISASSGMFSGASIVEDGTLKVWDLQNETVERILTGHTGWVTAVAVTPDGRWAISGSGDQTLKVWNLKTGTEERTLTGHTNSIIAVAVTPDGRRAISTAYDSTLKVWDLQTGQTLASFTGDSHMDTFAIASDGVTIVAGEVSGRVHFLRLEG